MKNCIFLLMLCAGMLLAAGCNKGPKPVATFTTSNDSVLARDTVSFTNQSVNALTYAWDFGDDSTSVAENPVHVYQKAGSFTVTLTAEGEGGDDATTQALIVVPSLTGKWSSTFTYNMPYNGILNLAQKADGSISGTMQLMEGMTAMPLATTSKVVGTSVTVEAIVETYKYSYKGTVNADFDYITGNFFMAGEHFGNWYAIKK